MNGSEDCAPMDLCLQDRKYRHSSNVFICSEYNVPYKLAWFLLPVSTQTTGFSNVVLISVLFWYSVTYSYRVVLTNKRRDFA